LRFSSTSFSVFDEWLQHTKRYSGITFIEVSIAKLTFVCCTQSKKKKLFKSIQDQCRDYSLLKFVVFAAASIKKGYHCIKSNGFIYARQRILIEAAANRTNLSKE